MNGFVNVLKPVGATASDVVVCLKGVLGEKVGHLGTLDPGAAGVLPVAVGKATRLFNFLTDKVKVYRAHFTFGKTTDTLDSYGVVTERGSVPSESDIVAALKGMVGQLQQLPPAYSAISVGGVKAYKLARNGVNVQLKTRQVMVYDFKFIRRQSEDTFVFDITCSAGTYIRSLARDLAESLGTVGYMSCLIRLQSGCFLLENAYTMDEIKEKRQECVLPVDFALSDLERHDVPVEFYDDLDNGRRVNCPFEHGYRKIYCKNEFFGLGTNCNGVLNLQYYMKNW